jgi:tetratricopeptide (TPR) repeat protein
VSAEFRKLEALLAMGRADEAAKLAEALPEREAPSAEFLRLRGRAQRAAGRVFDAEASFREVLSLAPQDAGLMADLATTLYGQGRHREALAFARDAVGARPEVAAWQCLLGVVAEALQLDDEAERALTTARGLAPTDAEAHTVYGYHSLRLGRVDAAERAFSDAVAASPSRAEALRGLARCALRRSDYVGAAARWRDALSADPRQRDPALDRVVWLGTPGAAPLRALLAMPRPVSFGLVALAVVAAYVQPFAGLAILGIAALGPLARIAALAHRKGPG